MTIFAHNEHSEPVLDNTRIYGYEVEIALSGNRPNQSFHYKGSQSHCRRMAMLKPNAREVVGMLPYTERQYVSAFGRGRM